MKKKPKKPIKMICALVTLRESGDHFCKADIMTISQGDLILAAIAVISSK